MTSNPNLAEDDTTPAKRSCLLENSWKFGPTRFAVSEKIQIIRLSETDPISNKKDAINKLVDALGNGVVNQDTGFLLQSSRSDAKKTLFRKDIDSPIVRCIYSQARDLAQKSVLIESHGDILHDNTQVQAIHIFAAGALVENRLFRVELTVRDYVETDHERNEQLLHSYIRADGKAYFEAVDTEEYGSDGVYQSLVRRKYVASKLTDLLTGLQRKNGIAVSDSAKKEIYIQIEKVSEPFWKSSDQLSIDFQSLKKILLSKDFDKNVLLKNFIKTQQNRILGGTNELSR